MTSISNTAHADKKRSQMDANKMRANRMNENALIKLRDYIDEAINCSHAVRGIEADEHYGSSAEQKKAEILLYQRKEYAWREFTEALERVGESSIQG